MNQAKRILGIVWILVGIGAAYFLIKDQAMPKFEKGGAENLIPAVIYSFILAPLILGAMSVFGYYSFMGEYKDKNS